jgi:hypothetical protein
MMDALRGSVRDREVGDDARQGASRPLSAVLSEMDAARARAVIGDALSSGAGMSVVLVGVWVWATTYPSLLSGGMLVWALAVATRHSMHARYDRPSAGVVLLLVYAQLYTVAVYASAVAAVWRAPAAFDPSSPAFSPTPFALPEVLAVFGPVSRLLGLVPAPNAASQIGVQTTLLLVIALYRKVTVLRPAWRAAAASARWRVAATAVASARSAAGGAAGVAAALTAMVAAARPSKPAADRSGTEAAAAGASGRLLLWLLRTSRALHLQEAVDALVTLALGYSGWTTMLALYVLAFSHVDVMHAGYVLLFVAFAVSPRFRSVA